MFPCAFPRCLTCPFANFTDAFSNSSNSLSYPIFHHLTCNSNCVIYIIECSLCGKRYVGQTRGFLRDRILQHLRNIRSFSNTSVLYSHFRACGISNFSFFAISRHLNDQTRLSKEAAWINALQTNFPHGLNSVSESASQPTNLILPFDRCAVQAANAIRAWCHVPLRITYQRSRNLKEHISSAVSL